MDNNLITSTPRAGESLTNVLKAGSYEMINQYIKQNVKLEDSFLWQSPKDYIAGNYIFSFL